MAHRAVVAERTSDGTYNVHYSHNGADDFQLKEILEDNLTVSGRIDWSNLSGKSVPEPLNPSNISNNDATVETAADTDIIDRTPSATGITEEQISSTLSLDKEALFIVEDGSVKMYYNAWVSGNALNLWKNNISVDVYDSINSTEPTKIGKKIKETDPIATIDNFDIGWLDDPTVRELVEEYHRYICEFAVTTQRRLDEFDNTNDTRTFLQAGGYVFDVDLTDATDTDLAISSYCLPIRLEQPYNMHREMVEDLSAHARFTEGAAIASLRNPSDEDIADSLSRVMTTVLSEYADKIPLRYLSPKMRPVVTLFKENDSPGDDLNLGDRFV